MLYDFYEYKQSGAAINPHYQLANDMEYKIEEVEPYAELKKLQVMIEKNWINIKFIMYLIIKKIFNKSKIY